jgi:DNA polymerase III subunit epsilon
MGWYRGRLAAFDIETTDVDVGLDRIVTAAVNLTDGDQLVESTNWLVDPGVDIPNGATRVHGITTERARAEGRVPAEAIDEVVTALANRMREGVPVIAFNARFDLTVLDREARRYGVRPLLDLVGDAMLVVDPLILDKHFDRFRRGKRTLSAVCAHYGVQLDGAHAASPDALAAARIARKQAQTFAGLGEVDLHALQGHQTVWATDQAASLESYFRKQGRRERVEQAWPIIPLRLANAA